ncbi:putative 2-phosphosulfolactate phosphatase [Aquisphaera giovannonii]|uniref:Probable 2-phosphosulfolactate phosphatase n=1 Tax=Aquisphaera giovannonii TaxID=406548 RepID=A0A5B9W374_9BACT|nr:2-phosphosulfolactate phosphatase [Aquisphaera giovannonii]QEH34541.1 putative 2-phosphosulfolactate phosphatase [Aquisphaera giovannonii]
MVFVHSLPGLIPRGALRGGIAVVIDVLRASTMIVHALAAGCREVIPCGEIEEARAAAAAMPPGTAILAGERHGVPIPGFDLGNSPGQCTAEACEGRAMIITTTNGTRAILASLEAEPVVVGSFVNFAATAQRLLHEEKPIHVVCAGTEGSISYEDTLLAGAFARHFKDLGHPMGNDEAEIAAGLWARVEESIWAGGETDRSRPRHGGEEPLVRYLTRGQGGRRVVELGLAADIADAARLNRPGFQVVAELRRDPLRIVARA